MEGEHAEDPTLFPAKVGEKLRAAREAQGLDLAEVANRTRIPLRHLEAIEKGNYTGLPSVTYAMGFAKAYARAIGADEVDIARDVRAELGQYERAAPMAEYPLDDPSRVPPRGLAWAGLIVAVLVLVGVGLWYGTNLFRGGAPATDGLVQVQDNAATPAPDNGTAAVPVPAGQEHVTLVALDTVWLRVSDETGKRLFEKEMAPGERYEVPIEVAHPIARIGRPDKLQVTINGSNVPPLGAGDQAVSVDVSAAALRARAAPGATPTPGATSTPARTGQRRLGPPTPAGLDYSTPANSSAAP
ncbi:helix-turn-helix domain-containing protein [Sphingomonas sp. JC676]|uniref:helix-turn-helix domain-containing protein n=1 Tax=Sphingomonas sp. JC676 TaxID=2768065 RepID=UPI001657D866|nr:helix-turn-helix domain-containing protein [Sphingomonas sp. JC676]MBC9034712.1 helix-turn-helix domain-containing protein [Sphingomonas sp. JC676]